MDPVYVAAEALLAVIPDIPKAEVGRAIQREWVKASTVNRIREAKETLRQALAFTTRPVSPANESRPTAKNQEEE